VPLSVAIHVVDVVVADRTERRVFSLEDDRRVAGILHSETSEKAFRT
jgi:hypothetical protein